MAKSSVLFLLLGLCVLASGLPYYGVKGPIRRYNQESTKYDFPPKDEVIEKPVEKPYQIEEVIEEHEPTIHYDDQKDVIVDGKDDYVPEDKDSYEDKDADYIPDIKDGDKDGDYVPDQKDLYVDKEPEYVPDKGDSYGKEPAYVPDDKDVYDVKEPDYVPEQKDSYGDKDGDYVPDIKEGIHGDKDGDYVPDVKEGPYGDKDGDYVPDVKEGAYDVKDDGYAPDVKEGSYDVKEEGYVPEEKLTWIQRLSRKWNKFEDKSREAAKAFGKSVHTAFHGVHTSFDKLWNKFKHGFSNVGVMITRGAHYVVKVVTTTVEEVKASELINKLEKRLEQGNEIVDEFFQKVGEKMTHYMEKHNHKHVDDAFFDYGKQENQKYPDIFQDPEIHQQVNKMVGAGIITQEEADMLSQSKKEFGLFDKEGHEGKHHEGKHDSYGHEGKIEEVEGSGSYDKVDQTVVDHKDVNYDQGKTDIDHHGDHKDHDHVEDQKDHHTIKKELEEKDSGIEERKQIEEKPYPKHKGGYGISFPKY